MTEEKVFQLHPLWVFGYASLLWNPGFPVAEERLARLDGYHRSFCMRSIHHRGTEDHPGLVLALDEAQDAACNGVALRVTDGAENQTIAYLRERELISSAYLERLVDVTLDDGTKVTALAYVIDPKHNQYAAHLTLKNRPRLLPMPWAGVVPIPNTCGTPLITFATWVSRMRI